MASKKAERLAGKLDRAQDALAQAKRRRWSPANEQECIRLAKKVAELSKQLNEETEARRAEEASAHGDLVAPERLVHTPNAPAAEEILEQAVVHGMRRDRAKLDALLVAWPSMTIALHDAYTRGLGEPAQPFTAELGADSLRRVRELLDQDLLQVPKVPLAAAVDEVRRVQASEPYPPVTPDPGAAARLEVANAAAECVEVKSDGLTERSALQQSRPYSAGAPLGEERDIPASKLVVTDEAPAWTDPEPWLWTGERYPDADPAGQDWDFKPAWKPRQKNQYVGDLVDEVMHKRSDNKQGDRLLELLIFVQEEHQRAGLTPTLNLLISLIVENRNSEHRGELADKLEALLKPECTLLIAGGPSEPKKLPFDRRVLVIDLETGDHLPGSPALTEPEGMRVAASVLPGVDPHEVEVLYSALVSGDKTEVMLRGALFDAAERVYAVNSANGWFEDERTVGDDIALLHSEVTEMLEAFRNGGLADQTGEPKEGATLAKPEGFGSEAADVLIRLLDTCKRRGVDLAWEFERKLAFNATRGKRHGGKRL